MNLLICFRHHCTTVKRRGILLHEHPPESTICKYARWQREVCAQGVLMRRAGQKTVEVRVRKNLRQVNRAIPTCPRWLTGWWKQDDLEQRGVFSCWRQTAWYILELTKSPSPHEDGPVIECRSASSDSVRACSNNETNSTASDGSESPISSRG